MISFKEIQKSYPVELDQIGFHQAILKEYLQFKMLEIIFNSRWAGNLVFLGGTNLRIIHNNNRFSEDLDFDIKGEYTDPSHEDMCLIICKELEKEGYDLEIDKDRTKKKPNRTAFTRFINFPGLLKNMGLHDDPNKKFLVKIDAEAHTYGEFDYEPEHVLINKFEVFTPISATPADVILSTKLCSILERSKGRDFYDIIFLSGLFKANEAYISNRFEFGQLKEKYFGPVHLQERIMAATENVNWDEKAMDVERFIIYEKETKKIRLFRNWVIDNLFFRTFGLACKKGMVIDARPVTEGMDTIKLRLNHRNPRYEISIPVNETKRIRIEGSRKFPDVRTGFKSIAGSEELHNMPDAAMHQTEYTDSTRSILCLELNMESPDPVNLEVRFLKE